MVKAKIAYYPLHHDEYLNMRDKLKPNELDIYLYLITKHPFADSKLEIDTSLISEQLGYHRRTVQLAIKKLASLNLLEVEIIKFKYKQARHGHESRIIGKCVAPQRRPLQDRPIETTDESVIHMSEFADLRMAARCSHQNKSHQSESVDLTSESVDLTNESVDPTSESVDRQYSLKPLPDIDSSTLQTIQTIQTIQTVAKEDLDFQHKEVITESQQKLPTFSTIKPPSKISDTLLEPLTEALRSQLRKLEIPIDKKIREVIDKYGESQAWKAIRHIEATKGGIRSKYGVFLYQIAKQAEEPPKKALSAKFLEWYNRHRGEIVEDIPPELLPLDRYQEPMVRLKSRTGELIEWQRAANDTETERSPFDLRTILENFPLLKDKLRGKKYERE
jgi:hypothetical protein